MKKISGTKKVIFICLFIIWILMSFFNVIYNTLKSYSEAKQWVFLTDQQKRVELFGNISNTFILINKNADQQAKILLYSEDTMLFYLSRYYVYPKKVLWISDEKKFQENVQSNSFTYLIVCGKKVINKKYKKIAAFTSSQSLTSCNVYQLWMH